MVHSSRELQVKYKNTKTDGIKKTMIYFKTTFEGLNSFLTKLPITETRRLFYTGRAVGVFICLFCLFVN